MIVVYKDINNIRIEARGVIGLNPIYNGEYLRVHFANGAIDMIKTETTLGIFEDEAALKKFLKDKMWSRKLADAV